MKEYKTSGKHVLMDIYNVSFDKLNDLVGISKTMKDGAELAGATVLGTLMHPFEPSGVTVLLLLSESHFSLHSYPNEGYCAIDCYTCGDNCEPIVAVNHLLEFLDVTEAENANFALVERGNQERMIVGIGER